MSPGISQVLPRGCSRSFREFFGIHVWLSCSGSHKTWYVLINTDFQPSWDVSVSEYEPGYGKVAAFEDSDPSFSIYRKFGWMHNRILLHLQDELADLEGQLEDLDKWEAQSGNPTKLLCRRLDESVPEESERRKLLELCRKKLEEYGESTFFWDVVGTGWIDEDKTLLRLQQKQKTKKPTKWNQNSLYNLIDTSESQLHSEAEWICRSDDLLALASDAAPDWLGANIVKKFLGLSKRFTLVCASVLVLLSSGEISPSIPIEHLDSSIPKAYPKYHLWRLWDSSWHITGNFQDSRAKTQDGINRKALLDLYRKTRHPTSHASCHYDGCAVIRPCLRVVGAPANRAVAGQTC